MEIHGSELLLSAQDIQRAFSGASSLKDPAFTAYVMLLWHRLENYQSPERAVDKTAEPLNDTTACITTPFSPKVVEMLATAIFNGAQEQAQTDKLVAAVQETLVEDTEANIARYKAAERKRRMGRLTLIQGDQS